MKVCKTCWKRGQIQGDCKECNGTGHIVLVVGKKTLSDKMIDSIGGYDYYREQDVKEALKEFIDWLFENYASHHKYKEDITKIAKKHFGERLI